MARIGKFFINIALSSLTIGFVTAISEHFLSSYIDSYLPEADQIKVFSRPGTLTLLSTNGEIIQKLGFTSREKVKSGQMPRLIIKAFVAAEDRRFYKHKGVDLWGISRAMMTNIKEGAVLEGGSTITQQLARIIFLSQERTIKRKTKEIALAYKLERQLTKEQIIEQYLNNVYLGSNAYGIADAAWIYFSKTPELLNLEEAALIAGLAPAPSLFSPLVRIDLAIKRRSAVLKKMYKAGYISSTELDNAIKSPLILKPATPKYLESSAPFFTSWVQQKLPKILSKEELEMGGLKIHTSLRLDWQKKAQATLRNHSPEQTEGALVAIEPKTGLVRVLVGGKDFKDNQFNRATQAFRSPGSTFKLFPYAAAIQQGYKPEDVLFDSPQCWYGYCPKNFGSLYYGEVSLSEALENSLNTVAVELIDIVGFEDVIATANRLGIGNERKLGEYYPLAIGAYEETVLNMTAAYAAVANRGIYIKPSPFEEIRGPNNKIIWSKELKGEKEVNALPEDVADSLNWMLKRVVKHGTGIAAFIEGREIAGKTGTSEGNRDLWFIGSVPQLTTGIWFGYDDNRKTNSGSGDAAFAWKQFFLKIQEDLDIINFPERSNS